MTQGEKQVIWSAIDLAAMKKVPVPIAASSSSGPAATVPLAFGTLFKDIRGLPSIVESSHPDEDKATLKLRVASTLGRSLAAPRR